MTVHAQSFLRNDDGSFTAIQEWRGPVRGSDYLEGALELTINGTALITTSMWDYIDDLWVYILIQLEDITHKREVKVYFPDQPIRLHMEQIPPDKIRISVKSRTRTKTAITSKVDLLHSLAGEGYSFFSHMMQLDPGSHKLYENEATRFASLRDRFQNG